MNAEQLRAILQSDFKLWEAATSKDESPTSVTKVIDLPYNIGITTVTLEGMDDANKRRSALAGFGDYIRGLVDNAVGEESITARARQKAARDGDRDGGQSDGGGSHTSRRGRTFPIKAEEILDPEAMASPDATAFGPEDMAFRAEFLRTNILGLLEELDDNQRELRGLEAFLEVYNASTHKKTPSTDSALEGEAEDGEA